MANWKKVIVSGSDASLLSVTTSGNTTVTGSLAAQNAVKFPGLTNASQPNIVGFDSTTGQLYYQGTGSFSANSASFATTASYAISASNAISSSYAISASNAISSSYAISASNAISSSFAETASSVNTLNQPVIITG